MSQTLVISSPIAVLDSLVSGQQTLSQEMKQVCGHNGTQPVDDTITSFVADGFTVGSSDSANSNGVTYYGFALKSQ